MMYSYICIAYFLSIITGPCFGGDFEILDPSNHSVPYESEFEAFEKHLLAFSTHQTSERSKRFAYLNYDTFLAVALLFGVPLTLVLPSLSNIFNKWRSKRSLDDVVDLDSFQDEAVALPHLEKISTYFHLVDIPEHHCQLRAICEFSAEPDKFYPLSDMILSRIRNPRLPPMIYLEGEGDLGGKNVSKSLFMLYNNVANEGVTKGLSGCEKSFERKCRYSMDKLLNMPTLRFWTAMQRFLKIKFTDGNFKVW